VAEKKAPTKKQAPTKKKAPPKKKAPTTEKAPAKKKAPAKEKAPTSKTESTGKTEPNTKKAPTKIAITQVRSQIGCPEPQRRTLRALGFTKKHQQTLVHDDTPAIRGMVRQLHHLLVVREAEE
jgi:ribosomal protein L30